MQDKLSVGVAMGGISPEHPVSLVSGLGMLRNLDPSLFRGFPILISPENRWLWPESPVEFSIDAFDEDAVHECLRNPPSNWLHVRFPFFHKFPACDIMLLALHGEGGEDGRLQGFLELAGQPYTGSASRGSALAMDKITAKQIYRHFDIPTPRYRVLNRIDTDEDVFRSLESEFGFPMVLKNPMGGSSLGLGMARNSEELPLVYGQVSAGADRVLVEEYIQGQEGTCGYLEAYSVLPPTEIRPLQDGFFTFEAKYQSGRTQEITPATFPGEVISAMQSLAARCHWALQLSVYSRTDFIYTGEALYVLETNNLPGFTPTSLLPQAAAHAGLEYQALLTHILETSLSRWRRT